MDYWVWAVLLLCVGFGLAILEVFVPSSGVLGFLSVCAILAAIFMGFRQGPAFGFGIVAAAAVGVPVLVMFALKVWPHTPIGRRLTLRGPSEEEVVPFSPEQELLERLVGRIGRARTKMLPSGIIVVDGHAWDAVSEGAPVDPGQAVRVVDLRGNWLVVRRLDGELPGEDASPLDRPLESLIDPFAEERES